MLGPLQVRSGMAVMPVRQGHQRALLAVLLLQANQVVSATAITEALWGPAPPPTAAVAIRSHVMGLRRALGEPRRIGTEPGGYLIRVADGELDLARFEFLLAAADTAASGGRWDTAASRAAEALALWRGEPLADVESEALALRELPRLAELRLQALETRIDADLHLGRHARVAAELQHLAAEHPLREHLHALLILALYRCGRQADALAAYQQVRTTLVGELGTEPGPELQRTHQRILAADPALAAPEAAGSVHEMRGRHGMNGNGVREVPRQLPAAVTHFTGRAAELDLLNQMLDQAGGQLPGTVVITAIGGTAGVGKTALANHWAHQMASRFEDGQLYANLRGFGPDAAPATPAETITAFLHALGVPPERVPPGLDAQAAMYRGLLAGRRMLIVLDNARDEEQVRPLLPASPGTTVIVTSRSQLAGLAAAECARLVTLDILTEAEATQMLAARIGAGRAAAEPRAVSEIASLCGRLPLALAIAAARAQARPRLPLAALATELGSAHGRLDALDTGDPAASVRVVFSWSVRQLSPAAARMFRLLGRHPGPDISVPAAASLAACGQPEARRLLAKLARAHLLSEHLPGRYSCHDLLRSYAAELALAADSQADLDAATGRMLDHYLSTACAAALLLRPSREPVTPAPARPGVTAEQLADHKQAVTWLRAERHVLRAAITLAARAGFDAHAWQIAWAIADYLDWRGYWHEMAAVQRIAVTAAIRLGDVAGQAESRRLLAKPCAWLGDYDEARRQLVACLELYRQVGDPAGEARTHQSLALSSERQGRLDAALDHARQAHRLFKAVGHLAGQARSINNAGYCHAQLGDYEQARSCCRQALALSREAGDRNGEAAIWDSLGYAEHHLGQHARAASCYEHALGIFRQLGDRYHEASTLVHLGDTHEATGNLEQAIRAWQQALEILDDLHHPDAQQVRARLR